jgi:hypothetical protein
MADHQRVIEFLRDVRQGAGSGGLQTVNEEIAHMAGEYAALCVQANDRLRQCSGFLQQGLRTEAIHLAEQPPNLLDLISQLDLPDPQAWAEFCQNNGYPVPPALQLERAAQLNEAYAQDQPLEHLLSRHRLLALSRAPVRQRLDAMRKIAEMDPGNANWEKDIRTFEQARLKELPATFYEAVKNQDHGAIASLMDELNRQAWLEEPPVELAKAVADAYGRVQRLSVEADLRKLVEPLREAFAARSLHECQALVQRWKNTMASGGVTSVSTELMDEIKPVVAFVNEQTKRDEYVKRFNESCKVFTKLLAADAPDSQLEAGYAKLKEFKEEIPEDLTVRYMNKRQGRRKDADRSHKVRLATIAGVFVVILAIGLIVVLLVSRGSKADEWARAIHNAVGMHSQEGLKQAQARIDELQKTNPGMLQEPKVAAAVSDYQALEAKYAGDVDTLKSEQLKLGASGKSAAGVLAKQDASMDEIRAAAGTLDGTINEAGVMAHDLAWADGEVNVTASLAGAQAIRKTMEERVAGVAQNETRKIAAELEAIPANTSTPDAATQALNKLSGLADRVNGVANMPLLDDATKGEVTQLAGRIAKRRQDAEAASGMADELQNVRTHTSSVEEIKGALEAFTKRFPSDSRSADFTAALDHISAAQAMDAWNQVVSGFKGGLAPSSLMDAQKRQDTVTAFLTAHPDFPKFAEGTQYAEYLHRGTDAMAEKGTWATAFQDFIGGPIYSELKVMDVSDGRRYYTLGDIKRVEHKMNNQVSVSFESLDLKPDADGHIDFSKRTTITVDPPLVVSAVPALAPHAKAVVDIGDSLKLINETNWDTFGIDIADRLIRNEQMDVVVKAILIEVALKTEQSVAGSLLEGVYDHVIADFTRQNPDQLLWPDPARVTDGTRKALKAAIEAIPPSSVVKGKLAAAKGAMFKSLSMDLIGTGILLKDDSGSWTVQSHGSPAAGSAVWTIVGAKAPDTGTHLVMVGSGVGDKFTLDDASLRNVPQGSIVYITRQ